MDDFWKKGTFYFSIALQGLLRNKLRSVLSCLGIIFGVASFVSMMAVAKGASTRLVEGIEQLGLRNIVLSLSETDSDMADRLLKQLRKDPLLSLITPVAEMKTAVIDARYGSNFKVMAVYPSFKDVFGLSMASGRFLHSTDLYQTQRVAVVGAAAARNFGLQYSSRGFITIGKELYDVVGRLSPRTWAVKKHGSLVKWDLNSCVFIPYDSKTMKEPEQIVVQVKQGQDVLMISKILSRILKMSGIDAKVVVPLALRNEVIESKKIFDLVLGTIAAISLLVGGIGIANVMLASVAERNTEIGLRRTFGATRGDILIQFLSEAGIMGIAGSAAGILFGIFCADCIEQLGSTPVSFTFATVAVGMLLGVAISLCSSLYPANKASLIDPLSAIRHNTW